jgi:hypothetical protein
MGEVIDFKTGERKEEMEKRKPTMKEMEARVKQLETIVGQFQGALQGINGELFQNNANGIALFRALEDKGIIGEDDIKESWQKHIVEPYEQEQDGEGEAVNDTVAEPSTETEDEAVEPTTETPSK